MVSNVASETLEITLSERDKRRLRVAAASRGVSMRTLVREWVSSLPPVPSDTQDEPK